MSTLGAANLSPMAESAPQTDRQRQLDLLQAVSCVAWADGSVDEKERQLLEQLVERLSSDGEQENARESARHLASWIQTSEQLEAVIPRIRANGDGQLAVKLAHMMAMVSRGPDDQSLINADERLAYRGLVERLELDEDTVQEAEWAARHDLASGRSFLQLLGDAMASFGAWPSQEVLNNPAMRWL